MDHSLTGLGRAAFAASLVLAGVVSMPAAEVTPRMLLLDGALAGSAVVAVGERGTILRSTDHARTWQPATVAATATLTGVSFAPASEAGWAVGHDALILATTDGGLGWTRQYQGENLQESFLDVLAVDAAHVIAVGAYGLCVVSKDGGRSWHRQQVVAEDRHLNRISRGPTGTLYLAGESGTLLRSTDHGASWTSVAAPYDGSFYGILPLDGRTLIAHGLRGRVFRTTDDGTTWAAISTPQPMLLATAILRKDRLLVFAGQARTLLVSADSGTSLRPSPQARGTAIAELIELDNGTLLALGEEGASLLELGPLPAEATTP